MLEHQGTMKTFIRLLWNLTCCFSLALLCLAALHDQSLHFPSPTSPTTRWDWQEVWMRDRRMRGGEAANVAAGLFVLDQNAVRALDSSSLSRLQGEMKGASTLADLSSAQRRSISRERDALGRQVCGSVTHCGFSLISTWMFMIRLQIRTS